MADITLRHGGAMRENVKLTDGDLTYRYGPKFLSRSAMKEHEAAAAARREYTEKLWPDERDEAGEDRPKRRLTDRERERLVRLTCDVIRSLLTATSDGTPDPGDLLYEGWATRDTVTEEQITALWLKLIGYDVDDFAEGGSPS